MIDIDASLKAIETHPTFWVKFASPSDATEELALEIKAAPRKQRRIIDHYIHMTTPLAAADTQTAEKNIEVVVDWAGMARALEEYIVGWEGFSGAFDQKKIALWLEAYGSYAVAFAQNFKSILDKYEGDLIQRKEAEAKN